MLAHIKRLATIALCLFAVTIYAQTPVWKLPFRRIGIADGLSSNTIQSIIELKDGRMAISTPDDINIYDGVSFKYIHKGAEKSRRISNYTGACHIYEDMHDVLWIKNSPSRLSCFDLRAFRYIENTDSLLKARGCDTDITDIFCDRQYRVWVMTGDRILTCLDTENLSIKLPIDAGTIQDIVDRKEGIYIFYSSSKVSCHNPHSGKTLYVKSMLAESEAMMYENTSLAVTSQDNDGIYQLRTGNERSIWMKFDTRLRKSTTLLSAECPIHTITLGKDHAYVTSRDSIHILNIHTDSITSIDALYSMSGARTDACRMNSVLYDKSGGLWLGSYDKGLFYTHRNINGQESEPIRLHPMLAGVFFDGIRLQIGDKRLPYAENYIDTIKTEGCPESISLNFVSLNFSTPTLTTYHYRIIGSNDTAWHEATCGNSMVDQNGMFHLPIANLSYGRYTIQVKAGRTVSESPWCQLTIILERPWWQIWLLYALCVTVVIACGIYAIHVLRERKHTAVVCERTAEPQQAKKEKENGFIEAAIQLIEKNMSVQGYGVEQLSQDLCMERTGLYKKVMEATGKTPSTLIRSIRLRHAARLIEDGIPVSEVAQRIGYSSTSYLSKSFQQEYGCSPADYHKESTKKKTGV